MSTPLSVLVIEDSEDDAILLVRELVRGGFDLTYERVDTADDMRAMINRQSWDAVISDFSMPDFGAFAALEITREHDLDIPFIIVSGTIGEEVAVEAMRAGANDYVMKGNFARLVPALERELREAAQRRAGRTARNALSASEDRLMQMAETIDDVFWIIDWKLRKTLFASTAYERIWGRPLSELYENADSWSDAMHSDDHDRVFENYLKLGEGVPLDEVYRIVRPDGTERWIRDRGYPIKNDAGEVVRITGTAQDITAQKNAEEALRTSEERLGQIARTVEDVFWIIDWKTQEALFVSDAYERVWGHKLLDVYAGLDRWTDSVHPNDRERVLARFLKLGEGETYSEVYRIIGQDGSERWIRDRGFPISNEAGEVVRVSGIAQDITVQKNAEEALRTSEERLGQIAEAIDDVFWIVDWDTKKALFVSAAYERIWGRNIPNLYAVPQAWADSFHPDDRERVWESFLKIGDGETFEEVYRIVTPDGSERWIRDRGYPVKNSAGEVIRGAGIAQDITTLKNADKALRASEERFLLFMQNLPGVAFIKDGRGKYIYANSQFCQLADKQMSEVIGFTDNDVFTPEIGRELSKHDDQVRAQNLPMTVEESAVFKGVRHTYVTIKFPMPSESGTSDCVAGVGLDISEIQNSRDEKSALEEQLRQAQKMESIGRLAGGVAHDLNNLLTPILCFSELLELDLEPGSDQRDFTKQIHKAGIGARDLVRQLLAFSRKQTLKVLPVDLNNTLRDFESLLRRTIKEDVTIQTQLGSDIKLISADVGQIEQVVMNLVVNAADAVTAGGNVLIETANAELDEDFVSTHDGSTIGEYVVLTVSDNGSGMDEETVKQVFEPFFSTKGEGGTGLGLSTVYGIVKQHGGYVYVDSKLGVGTAMSVYLPLATVQEIDKETAPHVQNDSEVIGTIMVVEDYEPLREVTKRALEKKGYSVQIATSGVDALAKLEVLNGSTDLLLTDVIMPEMGGIELFEKAQKSNPDLKVLYMSGYSQDEISVQGVLHEGIEFIQKPFTLEGLATKVKSILETE